MAERKDTSSSKPKKSTGKNTRSDGRDEKGRFTPDFPTAWKPGQSGNPAGRPKSGQALADLARDYLEQEQEVEVVGDDGKRRRVKMKRKDLFIQSVYRRALAGSEAATKIIWNYIDGLPQMSLDVNARGGFAITSLPPEDQENFDRVVEQLLGDE